ncbi:MAG: hypothetical protein A2V93_11905 [Ignavibacteria bacterium RBG_16_34_14]|nr:MAG: hypothetical protein A2V93_11905 [Ignavibacteria bacterium RBG_16_34_14]
MKRLLVLLVVLFTVFSSNTVVAQNWLMQNSNFPADVFVINFSAVNNQVCWAVGQKYPANSTPYAGYIRTTDGGTNWTLNTIPGITNGYLAEIFAIDADTAYVTCYKLVGTTGTIGIYKTTDGGVTWNRQDAYNSSQTGPGFIYFFDSQNGVVIGDYLETYTTTNGGTNWNPVTMPTPLTNEWTWLGESRFTVSGNSIWFCTNKGRIFKSTDKGYTWAVILSESQYYDWRPCIAFQNEQIGIYSLNMAANATDHIVRKTTDGGTTWSVISDPVLANLAPSTIQYIPGTSSTYILVAGRVATMKGTAVTFDAGETWTLLDTTGCFLVNFASYAGGWGSQFETNVVYKYVGPPLPVELISFTATSNGQKVILNWSTATELNNLGFEIQRSAEGKEFFTVGFVNGHGTTTEQQNYSYADKNLNNGKYFYRLKQVDFNGSYEYSDVVEVEWRAFNSYLLEQNYPNPFNPTTTIGFGVQNKSNVKITILNAIGEDIAVVLNEEREPGFHQVEFNAANLPSGVYFYQIRAGSFTETKKMILLR